MRKKTKKELVAELGELGVYDTGEKIKDVSVFYGNNTLSFVKMLGTLERTGALALARNTLYPMLKESEEGKVQLTEWADVIQTKDVLSALENYVTDIEEMLSSRGILETDYIDASFTADQPLYVYRVSKTTKADLEKALELAREDKVNSSAANTDDLVETFKSTHGADALADLIKANL